MLLLDHLHTARVREDFFTARICASVRNAAGHRGRRARASDYMIDLPDGAAAGHTRVSDGRQEGPSPDAVLAAFRAMGLRIVDKSTPAPPQPALPAPEVDDAAAHFQTLDD